jgi:predicted metal-dependent hydrolase
LVVCTHIRKLKNSGENGENMIKNIFPANNPSKKEYLEDITEKISKFVIENYRNTFDPTILYSSDKVCIAWPQRKNACIGICRKIQRIIYYNESKIEKLDYDELIELASHECAHLVYDGHNKKFWEAYHTILDACAESIKINTIKTNTDKLSE